MPATEGGRAGGREGTLVAQFTTALCTTPHYSTHYCSSIYHSCCTLYYTRVALFTTLVLHSLLHSCCTLYYSTSYYSALQLHLLLLLHSIPHSLLPTCCTLYYILVALITTHRGGRDRNGDGAAVLEAELHLGDPCKRPHSLVRDHILP